MQYDTIQQTWECDTRMISEQSDDELMEVAYTVYERHVNRDAEPGIQGLAYQLLRWSDVPLEQGIRILTRVRDEKKISGNYPSIAESTAKIWDSWNMDKIGIPRK